MAHVIVVLNDGETYTDITGCKIVVLSDEQLAVLEENGDPRDCTPIVEIDLTAFTPDHDSLYDPELDDDDVE